jgi:phosphate uptake regulator
LHAKVITWVHESLCVIYRRLQKLGGGSLYVSLPKRWAVRQGLKKGDPVSMDESASGSLIISKEGGDGGGERTFSTVPVSVADPLYLKREIAAAYLSGRDIIRLTFLKEDYRVRRLIRELGKELLGLELAEEEERSITFRFMLEPTAMTPDRIFRRMNSLTSSMYLDGVTALCSGDSDLAEDVVKRDEEIDRLYFLGVRLLRQIAASSSLSAKLAVSPVQALDYRVAFHHLEYIGDSAGLLAGRAPSSPGTHPCSQLREVAEGIAELQTVSQQYFMGTLREPYSSFLDSAGGLYRRLDAMAGRPELEGVVRTLRDIVRLVVDIADLGSTLYPYVK